MHKSVYSSPSYTSLICVCICVCVCISVSIYLYTSRERNQLLKFPEPLLFPWNDPWIHDSLEWRLHLLKGPSSLKKCSCVCGWVAFSVGLLPIESWKMRGLLSPWIISGPFSPSWWHFHQTVSLWAVHGIFWGLHLLKSISIILSEDGIFLPYMY